MRIVLYKLAVASHTDKQRTLVREGQRDIKSYLRISGQVDDECSRVGHAYLTELLQRVILTSDIDGHSIQYSYG